MSVRDHRTLLSHTSVFHSCAIFVAAFRFVISLYHAGPVFAYLFFVLRRNDTVVLVFSLQVVRYCFLAVALMCLTQADFSGL